MNVGQLKALLEQISDDDDITISVDVSTGEHDAGERLFAEIDTVQGNDKKLGCFGNYCDAVIIAIKQ